MVQKPRPQEIYKHFKGRYYQVLTLAEHTETGEEMVVYQALYGDFAYFCRPLWMFMEALDPLNYPDAGQPHRFERVRPIADSIRTKPDGPKPPEVLKSEARQPREVEVAYEPSAVMGKTIEEEARDLGMDPRVVEFLDSDSSERRLQILGSLARDITDEQIDICAMAIDGRIAAGETYERFAALRDLLLTKMRFEKERSRN